MRTPHATALWLGATAAAICCAACTDPDPVATTWTPVIAIADSGGARPTLAVDPSGKGAYLAYVATNRGESSVRVVRADFGAPEAVETTILDDAGPPAVHPQAPAQVAVGPNGSVFVAWITQRKIDGRRFPSSDIRLARSADRGRTFSAPIAVHPDPGFPTSHHFHNMLVAPDGTIYVSWLDGTERDRAQSSSARPEASHHDTDHHAHAGHGSAADDALRGTELRVARSVDGGRSFEPPVVVARGTCQCCRTALAADDEGNLYVSWRHLFGDNERDVAVARSEDGGRTFSAPVRVHRDGWQIGGCPHTGPAIAMDRVGRLHVVWYTGASGKTGVYYATSQDGGESFSPATALATDLPISQVAAATGGRAVRVAWEDPLSNAAKFRSLGERAGAVDLPRASGMMPALAATAERSVAAWRESQALHVALLASSRD